MKVYVDKNNVDVLDDLFDATNSYECWACNRDDNLEIVSLTDYTKQVRKEIVQEITQEVKKLIDSKDFKLCNHEYANGYCFGLQYDLAKILDQLQ